MRLQIIGLFILCLFFLAHAQDFSQPRTPLEKKIYLLYEQSKKAESGFSKKKYAKVLVPLFKTLVDIEHITRETLGKFYQDFTEKEIRKYQQNFMVLLLSTLQAKSSRHKKHQFSFRFIDYPWEKSTKIAALRAYIDKKSIPLIFIFEFEETGKYLIDFHLNEQSSIKAYHEQFKRIIDKHGKNYFLKLLERRASKTR